MARSPKYNWIKLKEDWLLSELSELSVYFANLENPIPKHTYKRNTVGWREEKEAFRAELSGIKTQKALEDPDITAEKKKILERQKTILRAKDNIISKLSRLWGNADSGIEKFESKDAIAVVNLLKTELGESTVISKTKLEGAGENGEIELSLGEDFKYFLEAIKK
jgi:hypothetical protein